LEAIAVRSSAIGHRPSAIEQIEASNNPQDIFCISPFPLYLCPPKKITSSSRQNPCGLKNHLVMKKGIHPGSYKLVVFKDMSNGHTFLSRSTAGSKETIKWEDGNDYPLIKLEISSTSHPFFTGKNVLVDTAGRIDKFKKKYEKKK
jgi:large subunit ribosomal protein L31